MPISTNGLIRNILLKSTNETIHQSTISKQRRLSRPKTNQLKTMEKKGRIKREDKGREKIVTLLESEQKITAKAEGID